MLVDYVNTLDPRWLWDEVVGPGEMALRAFSVYIGLVLLVRLSEMRFMGRATAFDVIIGILLGSIASRAITGNAPFWAAIGATATLLVTHWIIAWSTFRWHALGGILKGRSKLLVRNGSLDEAAAKRAKVSTHDLMAAVRHAGLLSLDQVAESRLERSGEISVSRKQETRIIDVDVVDGVKTVRLIITQ